MKNQISNMLSKKLETEQKKLRSKTQRASELDSTSKKYRSLSKNKID